MKTFIRAALVAAMLTPVAAVTGPAGVATEAQAGPGGGYFACVQGVKYWDVLWIRRWPSTKSRKIGAIPSDACGVRVNYNRCRGSWCKVKYRGVRGWAHTRYLG